MLIMPLKYALLIGLALSLHCLDDSGSSVSWYAALKMTEYAYGPFGGKTYAVRYMQYFDADHLHSEIQDRPINQTTFMTYTLGQLNSDSVSYVLYK